MSETAENAHYLLSEHRDRKNLAENGIEYFEHF